MNLTFWEKLSKGNYSLKIQNLKKFECSLNLKTRKITFNSVLNRSFVLLNMKMIITYTTYSHHQSVMKFLTMSLKIWPKFKVKLQWKIYQSWKTCLQMKIWFTFFGSLCGLFVSNFVSRLNIHTEFSNWRKFWSWSKAKGFESTRSYLKQYFNRSNLTKYMKIYLKSSK